MGGIRDGMVESVILYEAIWYIHILRISFSFS